MNEYIGYLIDKDGNTLFPDNTEYGTFKDGEYIKFSNGLAMVFYKKSYTATTSIGFANGLYRCSSFNIGNFPFSFTTLPLISITPHNTNEELFWGSCYQGRTTTSFPKYIIYAAENSVKNFELSCLAIGKWK